MSVYVTFFQEYGMNTTQSNLHQIGEVYDFEELIEGRASKSSCDGQTSKTPPRYADDNLMSLFFNDKEYAVLASEHLREGVASSIYSGSVVFENDPYWLNDLRHRDLLALAIAVTFADEIRKAFSEEEVSDSMLQTAAEEFLFETGEVPTEQELLLWISVNRNWNRI